MQVTTQRDAVEYNPQHLFAYPSQSCNTLTLVSFYRTPDPP